MDNYLIEFRFQGKAKKEIKNLIYHIDKKFNLNSPHRAIPHITLVGPFPTSNEKKLIKNFYEVCNASPFPSFKIKGYGHFDNSSVIYVNINPSKKLDDFRWNLSCELRPYCKLKPHDYDREFYFHATLAKKMNNSQFNQIKNYVDTITEPDFKHFVLRTTLLKNGKILREYDFLQRRMLSRSEALSSENYSRTIKLLKKYFNGGYNPDSRLKRNYISRIYSFFKRLF